MEGVGGGGRLQREGDQQGRVAEEQGSPTGEGRRRRTEPVDDSASGGMASPHPPPWHPGGKLLPGLVMDNKGEDEHEEELDFHLGANDDSSSDDENLSSNSSLSSMGNDIGGDAQRDAQGDNNCANDHDMYTRTAAGVEMNNTLDEYWEIVNKTFATEGEAYTFYNKYAKGKGFSVRKQKVRHAKHSEQLLFRRFLCSREGERDTKWLEKEELSRRPRPLTRCLCQAKLDIRLNRTRGLWYVSNFVDEHNHRLATKDEVPFLWSHRKMKDFQKTEIMAMEAVGIRKHVIMDVLQCRYGGYSEVGIVRKDAYNFSSRNKRKRIAHGDAMAALGLLESKQKDDPDFFYDYQLDGDGRLRTMFWCDTQSRMDYQCFGDVVVFDSTYRMNRYKMPFVPFVGMNQHRSTTLFGCGIVSDERVETFTWLLRSLMKAMCQQKPKSIITDGDNAMIKAIREVLPGVNHRICSWHVEENLPKHLGVKAIEAFRPLIYYGTSPAKFEERWKAFTVKYQTASNSHWLKMMHSNKKLWAASFQFEKFFLGMKTNQRSESLNSSLHRHLNRQMTVLDMVEHYENCVTRFRETEADLDSRDTHSNPVPLTDHKDIEVAFSEVLTATNFYMLQEELSKTDDFLIYETLVDIDSQRFLVARKENKKSLYLVDNWSSNSEIKLKCSCRKMDRDGLPCSHILLVLVDWKLSELPKCCILRRHSKHAKGGLPSIRESNLHGWTTKRTRYSNLTILGAEAFDVASNNLDEFSQVKEYLGAIISKKYRPDYSGVDCQPVDNESFKFTKGLVRDPLVVVNKGAPRKSGKPGGKQNRDGKRIKSFHESRRNRCTVCRKPGHNRRSCPRRAP